jgi:hypothetical protein
MAADPRSDRSLFFEILDGAGDPFVDAIKVRKAIEADPNLNRGGGLALEICEFERTVARGPGQGVIALLKKTYPPRDDLVAAMHLLVARHCGDIESELWVGQLLLNTFFMNEGLAPQVRNRRLVQALGFFASASGASAMQLDRLCVSATDAADVHGYRLIAEVRAAIIPNNIFDKFVDTAGADEPIKPGERVLDGWNGNRILPHSGMPARVLGFDAAQLYAAGHANPIIAAGAIAARLKNRLPSHEEMIDEVFDNPADLSNLWQLIDALKRQTIFDCSEEIEGLIFLAAQSGDRRAMLESAGFAIRRGYHSVDRKLLTIALGLLAVGSGARPIAPHDEYENSVDAAIGSAGEYLVDGLAAQTIAEANPKDGRTWADSFLESEAAIGEERRQDELAEAVAADTVIDDEAEADRSAKPDSGTKPKSALKSIRQLSDREARILAHREAAARAAAARSESVKIILSIGNQDIASKENMSAVSKFSSLQLPRKMFPMPPDLQTWRAELVAEFPYATTAIDAVFGDLVSRQMNGKRGLHFRPTLFVGDPGCGKSRLGRKLAESAGLAHRMIPCGGIADSHFGGVARGWSSGHPSLPLDLMRAANIPNPLIVMDEIDKTGSSRHNGNLIDVVLGMLEPETAKMWTDPFIQGPIDVNHVNWIFTANSLAGLPAPFLDRVRVVHVDSPRVEHVPALSAVILKELGSSVGHAGWMPRLEPWEMEGVVKVWKRNPSIRWLRCLVEAVMRAREQAAPRH